MKILKLKKFVKISICSLLIAVIFLCFTACSSSGPIMESTDSGSIDYNKNTGISFDVMDSVDSSASSNSSSNSNKNESAPSIPEDGKTENNQESNVSTNRKIITEHFINAETKEFDKLYSSIKEEVNKLNGYFESSTIEKNGIYRYSKMIIRIPQTADEQITSFIEKNSNVVRFETNTEDVTLKYSDIKSKIEAYKIEKTQLESLMEKAVNLTEVLEIQDRLTQVIYEIETREAQLRTYDNLVDYTTINLTITEVEIETPTTEPTVFETIKTNLINGFRNIGDFFVGLFVVLVSSIPYLLIIAIVTVVVTIVKCKKKKCKKNKENK